MADLWTTADPAAIRPALDDLLAALTRRPAWMRDAACREHDPALWFPERGAPTAPAKAICGACLVRTECVDYALELGERHGVWGALSGPERAALRREAA